MHACLNFTVSWVSIILCLIVLMASKKLAADVLSDRILSALLEETETFKFVFIEIQLFSDTPGFWCQGLDTRICSPEFISLSLHVTYFPVILRFSQY